MTDRGQTKYNPQILNIKNMNLLFYLFSHSTYLIFDHDHFKKQKK